MAVRDFDVAEIKTARPTREAHPELVAEMTRRGRRGRPKVAQTKVRIDLRVSADTLAKFKATGKGWQTRMSAILDKAVNAD